MAYLYPVPEPPSRRSETRRGPRHLLTASTLDGDDIDDYCQLAEAFEARKVPTGRSAGLAIALLFFQPSTRTRIGFEVATVALGSHAIGIEDMSASRSNKRTGESLEDCAAVFAALCDRSWCAITRQALRPAWRRAPRCPSSTPATGGNEHPSQALIDIYALRRGLGRIRGRRSRSRRSAGRTVRSLCQLLRYEAPGEVLFCPPPHIPVPDDVLDALARHQSAADHHGHRDGAEVQRRHHDGALRHVGYRRGRRVGLRVAAADPGQPRDHPEKIARLGSRALLYHPLPRQDEIHPACDNLDNARYFEQVRLSKFMRMAILDRALSRD